MESVHIRHNKIIHLQIRRASPMFFDMHILKFTDPSNNIQKVFC